MGAGRKTSARRLAQTALAGGEKGVGGCGVRRIDSQVRKFGRGAPSLLIIEPYGTWATGQFSVHSSQFKIYSLSSSVYRNRDKTAMNRAQLLKAQDDSLGLMSGPPARHCNVSYCSTISSG
jgi:hypothetical protein